MKVKNFKDIISEFDYIENVKTCGLSVIVNGIRDDIKIIKKYTYSAGISKFVALKVSNFIHINLKDKHC